MSYKLMLKELRNSQGISQEEMAEKLGMKLSTYRTWERGISRISLENACEISRILNCTPNDLCGWYIDHPEDRPASTSPPAYTADEANLVESYRALTPSRRVAAREMMGGLAGGSTAQEAGGASYEEGAA